MLIAPSVTLSNPRAIDFTLNSFGSRTPTTSTAVGDVNGDGALDIVVGNNGQSNSVYLNDGTGRFDTVHVLPDGTSSSDATTSVALGDINDDGAIDIIAGNYAEPNTFYLNLNDGTGQFAPAQELPELSDIDDTFKGGTTTSIAVGDIDGDGHFDIVAGNHEQRNTFYLNLNDGTGQFAPAQPLTDHTDSSDATMSITLTYINDDDALDIVAGNGVLDNEDRKNNEGKANTFYLNLNDGTGQFAPAQELPELSDTDDTFKGGTTTSIAVGDINGDGHFDIVAGNHNEPTVVYIQNVGNQNTQEVSFSASQLVKQNFLISSVALGDVNGDDALDIVVGQDGSRNFVYQNLNPSKDPDPDIDEVLFTNARYLLDYQPEGTNTTSIAVGDVTGDGALDIIAGNDRQSKTIYQNNNTAQFDATLPLDESSRTVSVAVGDVNNDDFLDIIAGNQDEHNTVYFNDGTGQFITATQRFTPTQILTPTLRDRKEKTWSIVVGDLNGDGALDIVAGNENQPNTFYLNDGTGQFAPARALPDHDQARHATRSIAVGDLNGDGALDIVAGNDGQPNTIYLNDGEGQFASAKPLTDDTSPDYATTSVALGDLNGDGALDIVAGNENQPNTFYLNDGTGQFAPALVLRDRDPAGDATKSIMVGDLNGDGALDIIAGNKNQPNTFYLNDGTGQFASAQALDDRGITTESITVGDLNGDGALDIIAGNSFHYTFVYVNDGMGQFDRVQSLAAPKTLPHYDTTWGIAVGDINNDGALDIITGNNRQRTASYVNAHVQDDARLPNNLPYVTVRRPSNTRNANFFSTPEIISNTNVIDISYTLFDKENDPVRAISATYSLDGGGSWRPAVAAEPPALDASSTGRSHIFKWDLFASGFFGQSDNVVFRMVVYPDMHPQRNGVAGPYLRSYASATTFPFRVQGTQVQVIRDEPTPTAPEPPPSGAYRTWLPLVAHQPTEARAVADEGAIVYRLSEGQERATVISDQSGRAYRTNHQGYLQGRGPLQQGDQLIALDPIAATDTYTIYLTNATPKPTGLDTDVVREPGIQQLTVSHDNPLVVFDLSVSLEWDARTDTQFLSQLNYDLQRASELLYDWTNGQAVLGQLTVYQNKEQWDDADIRIYASNRVRPNAAQGGVVSSVRRDPDTSQVVYAPGQVRMGANWNRYGDPSGTLGEDWPRALTHELGHYLFHLDDNYLGMDEQGRLITVDTCPGAMSDPYRDDYSEFHPGADWLPACQTTLSQRSTKRSDWDTITTFFPWLHAPDTAFGSLNSGPNQLPLAITQIIQAPVTTPREPLDVPIFYLTNEGERVIPGAQARAFLFRDSQIVDLGRPVLDQIHARGAQEGDWLCVYDLTSVRKQMGCDTIGENQEQLPIATVLDWQPVVQVSLETSRTLEVTVTEVDLPGQTLYAQLIPASATDQAPLPTQPLTLTEASYTTKFTTNETPLLEGFVHVWVDESGARREVVTDFTLGGGPARIAADARGPVHRRSRSAPAISADGQVILFTDGPNGENQPFYALQAATALPDTPSWATVIGSGYYLTTTASEGALPRASISFSYLGSAVPPNEEDQDWLRIHFWDGQSWQPLDTYLDTYYNIASATATQPGLYALMSSIEIPLEAGWNQIAYPVKETRVVATALASLDGVYTTVYGIDPTNPDGPWLIYDVGQPDELNTLRELHFGKGYLIYVTQPSTLRLKGPPGEATVTTASTTDLQAPTTYTGKVHSDADWQPMAGMSVQALVAGQRCGQGTTYAVDGAIWYLVHLTSRTASCQASDQAVTFTIDGHRMQTTATAQTAGPQRLPLQP